MYIWKGYFILVSLLISLGKNKITTKLTFKNDLGEKIPSYEPCYIRLYCIMWKIKFSRVWPENVLINCTRTEQNKMKQAL